MAAMDRAALELLLTRAMPFGKHKDCLMADLAVFGHLACEYSAVTAMQEFFR